MSDVIKVATRDSYGKALVELADAGKDFVVVDADLAADSHGDGPEQSQHQHQTDKTNGNLFLHMHSSSCMIYPITRVNLGNCNTQLASCKYPRTASSQHLSRISKKRC